MTNGWKVERHGGRTRDAWRAVTPKTMYEDQARFLYATQREKLRQGGLRLVDPDGKVVESTSAPRLRTRW